MLLKAALSWPERMDSSHTSPGALLTEIARLQAREQQLMHLLNSARDAVLGIDAQGLVIEWNLGAEQLLGWTAAQALGQSLAELIIPHEFRAAHTRGLNRYLATRQSTMLNRMIEVEALRKDGTRMPIELSVWPIHAGDRVSFGAILRDMSERKRLEQKLAATLQERETILNSSVVGIVFLTAHGRFRWANPAMLSLFRGDPANPLHSMEQVYTSREQYLRVGGEVVASIARGEVYRAELPMRRLDNQPIWVSLSGQAVSPRDLGEGTVWTILDITERKQAEGDIRHALAQQKELNEMRSRFVAMISHEFRTPLATIFSSVELLDDYGCAFPEQERHEVLGLIKGAVARMNTMVDQVLLTSQLEAGGFRCGPAPVRFAELLTQLTDEMARLDGRRHHLQCDCNDLTQERQADARLVRHIVTNLLGNALKYSAEGRHVWLRARADGERVMLEVQDQGIGIPASDIPRLFERFHRGSNVGNVRGTGMGLHIVQECVALHAGRLEVVSEEARGSTFRLWLHAPVVTA